jgi:transcription initiation factor TFIID TATA-box-binding protein
MYFQANGTCFLSSYEPELHPGVTYKLTQPKATLKIFSTGSVTVTGEFLWWYQEELEFGSSHRE